MTALTALLFAASVALISSSLLRALRVEEAPRGAPTFSDFDDGAISRTLH